MKSYLSRLTLLTLTVACALATPVAAADWPQWRGPNHDGSSDAKDLPEKFGKGENVLWTAKLPGPSHGTPIISGEKVFTAAIDSNRKMHAICLNRADGKVLWDHTVGGPAQIKRKGENDVASPSPVTDGKTVVFTFGTGDVAAFDHDGKQLWSRNLQKEVGKWNINWIYGSSPTLYKGKLYVPVLHATTPYDNTDLPGGKEYEGGEVPSYILALDPATGKELWRHVRPSDAVKETRESYATLIPHTAPDGTDQLLMVGGSAVTAHDPTTGREVWRFSGWDPNHEPFWRLIPSVVAGGGYVFACAPKGGPVMAIKTGGVGDVSASHKAWWSDGKQLTSDVSVPLFYKGRLYVLGTNSKKLYRVEPATGAITWTADLGGSDIFRASPTGADGRIYCMNRNGEVWVVDPESGKVLHQTSLDAPKGAYGSIAVADGILLIRAGDAVHAFGKK